MERNTRTPVIDGGVVNAPGNTTARHDFAENPQHGHSGTETTASGPGYGRTATAEQPYTGQGNNTGLDYGRTTTAEQPYTGQGNNTGLDYGRTTTAEQPYTGQGNNTGVDYGRTTTAEQPYTGQGNNTGLATDTRPTGSKIRESASGVKGLAAAVHGTGEMLRGHINATVDRAVNDKAGEARNSAIAAAGENEITTGQFSHGTKNREGAIPGADGDRRNNRDLRSGHVE